MAAQAVGWKASVRSVVGVPGRALGRLTAGAPEPRPDVPALVDILAAGARVLWVAAHPDDESMAGSILARAGLMHGNPLHLLVLTHGEGGHDAATGKSADDLAERRAAEMAEVARLYGATLAMHRFWNAPLPVESFPPRHEIAKRWLEQGRPAQVIAQTIRAFRPDVLLTFSPVYGATGHPEHQLASRFATAAVRHAADPAYGLREEPHRVPHVYYVLNRYGAGRVFGAHTDPLRYTEALSVRDRCPDGRTCAEVMAANTRPHQTQNKDMGAVRLLSHLIRAQYVRRVDPFAEPTPDPLEPAARGGMG